MYDICKKKKNFKLQFAHKLVADPGWGGGHSYSIVYLV